MHVNNVTFIRNLLCLWTFQEPPGIARVAHGRHAYALVEQGGTVSRADDGIFGPHSASVADSIVASATGPSSRNAPSIVNSFQ